MRGHRIFRAHGSTQDRRRETLDQGFQGTWIQSRGPGVHLRSRKFSKSIEVADVCAEVKRAAKNVKGSNLFMDRRQGEEQSKAPTYAVDPA